MNEEICDGPWRATRLWNSIVRNVQEGLPLRKHRRQLRTYENCFTAIEAIDWLHKHLKKNPNFGVEVTKEQTVMLLDKLLLAGVIQPVETSLSSFSSDLNIRDSSSSTAAAESRAKFKPGNDLYRLVEDFSNGHVVMKPIKTARVPLSDVNRGNECSKRFEGGGGFLRSSFRRTLNKFKHQHHKFPNDVETEDECKTKLLEMDESARKCINMTYLQSLPSNSLVVLDNDDVWKDVFSTQLRNALSEAHVNQLEIDANNIIYNMTAVSPKGVVQLKKCAKEHGNDLPNWTLSAMKCLASWPDDGRKPKCEPVPNYPGFGNDVFEVVKEYFVSNRYKNGPLTTYNLFDVFVSALIKAEAVGVSLSKAKMAETGLKDVSLIADKRKSVGLLNRQYTETNLDEASPQAKTSTPNGSRSVVPQSKHRYYIMRSGSSTFVDNFSQLSNQERVARIRRTHQLMPTSVARHPTAYACENLPPPPMIRRSNQLNPGMSTTDIMRNFLPPNTCFETAFMNEQPVTRIVAQRHTDVLPVHLDVRGLNDHRPGSNYTPVPSGRSIVRQGGGGSSWDSRSVVTAAQPDRLGSSDGARSSADNERSGRSRLRRSAVRKKRKSIAVMETNSKADREVAQFNGGDFSSSPARRGGQFLHRPLSTLPVVRRVNCPQARSSSVDNLLNGDVRRCRRSALSEPDSNVNLNESSTRFLYRYQSFSSNLQLSPSHLEQKVVCPAENVIKSKTVRGEKRKQRDKQMNRMDAQRSTCCRVQIPASSLPNLQNHVNATSPNSSGNTSSLSGSANDYNRKLCAKGSSCSLNRNRNSSAYQTKLPRSSFGTEIDRPFPGPSNAVGGIMDRLYNCDGKMLCVRAEPYLTSALSSSQDAAKKMSDDGVKSAVESFKLLGLLLPPENRRKLQLLLKFMKRLSSKENLNLDSAHSCCGSGAAKQPGSGNVRALLLNTFTETILNTGDDSTYDLELSKRIVLFFLEHYDAIWIPPTSLRKEVEERVYQSLVTKRIEAGEDPFPITFCRRVSNTEYENQKKTQLEAAMVDLLEQIIFDDKMSVKEKRKKLKKFKESHPKIYNARFPTEDSQPDCMKKQQSENVIPALDKIRNTMRI